MKLLDAQWEWTPNTGPWRDEGKPGTIVVYKREFDLDGQPRWDLKGNRRALWNGGGRDNCDSPKTVTGLLAEFHALVVRDGLDPQVVHREFLKIDEFRKAIAPDCEGA
jgi:hypothetical protein